MTDNETGKTPSCPRCGRQLESDFAFCPNCGQELTAEKAFDLVLDSAFSRLEVTEARVSVERISELDKQLLELEQELDDLSTRFSLQVCGRH